MCGIIVYFTDPKAHISVVGGIHTALTMLQHRGQGEAWRVEMMARCLWNHDL